MLLKYTGNAATFNFEGTLYARKDVYDKAPHLYDHSYDTPIKGLSKERAAKMAATSNMHHFEDVTSGEDVLEAITSPSVVVASNASPDVVKLDTPTKK